MKEHKARPQIFQSFDALKGFHELLEKQERVIVSKPCLSEENLRILDEKIHKILPGMMITLIIFDHGDYIQIKGTVVKINLDTKIIQIVKKKVPILNILDIQSDEFDCWNYM